MSGTLGLGPEDFRVLGLALAEFSAGTPTDPDNDTDREHAENRVTDLARWGFITAGENVSNGDHRPRVPR